MGNLKGVLLFAVFLLLASSALAVSFDVEVSPTSKSMRTNESSVFDLVISHEDDNETIDFEIFTPEIQWDVVTDPLSDRILSVEPNREGRTTLVLRSLGVNPGHYVVPVHVRELGTSNLKKINLNIGLISPFVEEGVYVPAIRVLADVPEMVDPRKEIELLVSLENQNVRELDDVVIKVRSSLINQDYTTTLGSLERKEVKFNAVLDPRTSTQTDLLRVSVIASTTEKSYQFDSQPSKFEVIEFGNIAESENVDRGFLRTQTAVTLTNNGNSAKTSNFYIKRNVFRDIFTSSSPKPTKGEVNGDNVWVWNIDIPAGRSVDVVRTTSFRIPFIILILAIIGAVSYYLFRTPLIVTKSAVVLNTKEGGTTEFKVVLEVKNRSPHVLKHVQIIDKVPKIADIIREFDIGSLAPTKIMNHPTKGTLVKFTLDEVDKFEERIITYKAKSKLSILGSMNLPMATTKFVMNNHHRKSVSNSANLSLITRK